MPFTVKTTALLLIALSSATWAQAIKPEAQVIKSDSYLIPSCYIRSTTSGYPKYTEAVIYGEQSDLEVELRLTNESNRTVSLPEGIQNFISFELKQDASKAITEDLDIVWRNNITKFGHESGAKYDETLLTIVEPGTSVRTSLILALKSGKSFKYGYYQLECYTQEDALKFGKSGRGGQKFRIIKPEANDDVTSYYVSKANQYLDENQLKKALEYYQKAAVMDPNNLAVLTGMGYTYLGLKDYDNAIKNFEKALPETLKAGKSGMPIALARAYLAIDQETKAMETLRFFVGENDAQKLIEKLKTQLKGQ